MEIKSIELNNIRSFLYEKIEFKPGSTLLAGDIGSGKTSVLMAIEFGLFGLQPGQRGSGILRSGEESGGVNLVFEVDDKIIEVSRTLKRGKTVSQDYAAITIDGQTEEMSVTELKTRVLKILNYPSEFSKKQNMLYKFTVYTPQEEMKQIILEDSETRLNTLRHVFGVDKYRKILNNTAILRLKLREEKRLYEGIVLNLDNEKKLFSKHETSLSGKEDVIFELNSDLLLKIENRKNKEKEKVEAEKKILAKSELKSNLGKTEGFLYSKTEISKNNEKMIEVLKKEIEEFKLLNFNPEEMQNIEEEILRKKKQKEKFAEINIEINSKLVSINRNLEDCDHLTKQMQSLDVCPTCHQNVDAVYRANVLNKNHNDISLNKRNIEELEIEKKTINEKLKESEILIDLLTKKLTDLKILKMKLEGINEKELKLVKINNENEAFKSDIILLKNQIEIIKSDLLELSKYDIIFENKSRELTLLLREERISDIKLAEAKKEIEMIKKSILELDERIKKIEEVVVKLAHISEIESWLNRKFSPLISDIERRVMVSLKHEFGELFSKWFNVLVPEGLSVSLSDDFTPIIEQEDYEISYSYLSGGERTAIALAYRLALTHVINSLMSKIKTRDLVILDEPTDGFSSEQLNKMREVLDDLKVKQLIIVSHEQRMEDFVENVIKFKKEYGVSFKLWREK